MPVCTKFVCGRGSARTPLEELTTLPQTPLIGFSPAMHAVDLRASRARFKGHVTPKDCNNVYIKYVKLV
jgi:hypothetical protein